MLRRLQDELPSTRSLHQRHHSKASLTVARPQTPILLPGEQTSTRVEPAKHIYAAVIEVMDMPGVLDVGIWVGHAWADEPRDRTVGVVPGWDRVVIVQGAEKLAQMFWDARQDFKFVAPSGSLDECLQAALAPDARPYFISNSGDNPTAGRLWRCYLDSQATSRPSGI